MAADSSAVAACRASWPYQDKKLKCQGRCQNPECGKRLWVNAQWQKVLDKKDSRCRTCHAICCKAECVAKHLEHNNCKDALHDGCWNDSYLEAAAPIVAEIRRLRNLRPSAAKKAAKASGTKASAKAADLAPGRRGKVLRAPKHLVDAAAASGLLQPVAAPAPPGVTVKKPRGSKAAAAAAELPLPVAPPAPPVPAHIALAVLAGRMYLLPDLATTAAEAATPAAAAAVRQRMADAIQRPWQGDKGCFCEQCSAATGWVVYAPEAADPATTRQTRCPKCAEPGMVPWLLVDPAHAERVCEVLCRPLPELPPSLPCIWHCTQQPAVYPDSVAVEPLSAAEVEAMVEQAAGTTPVKAEEVEEWRTNDIRFNPASPQGSLLHRLCEQVLSHFDSPDVSGDPEQPLWDKCIAILSYNVTRALGTRGHIDWAKAANIALALYGDKMKATELKALKQATLALWLFVAPCALDLADEVMKKRGLDDGLRYTEVLSAANMRAIRDEVNRRWKAMHPAPLTLMRPAFIIEQRHGDTVIVPPGWYHAVRNERSNLKVAADGVHLADFPLYIEAHYRLRCGSPPVWRPQDSGCADAPDYINLPLRVFRLLMKWLEGQRV